MKSKVLCAATVIMIVVMVSVSVFAGKSGMKRTVKTEKSMTDSYVIVDTDQSKCYNTTTEMTCPQPGQSYYGQDAQYDGTRPSYRDNGDGTVTDLNTGLMWQRDLPDDKYPYDECVIYADTATVAGYDDWRLPTIKELYSLILFSGVTGMSEASSVPYLDTDYFDFRFGGTVNPEERFIDAQYATSTLYKGTTMGGNETMFGVNFVDGRIKGYPTSKDFEIKLVRGRDDYGINDFVDNENGTITDNATGLMWDQSGSKEGMNWEDALAWVAAKNNENYLGFNDWRLPNAKELQSIVDYERSPSYSNSAAISPLFAVPVITDEKGDDNYPFYWASTTHEDGPMPDKAVYVCFGEALGYMAQHGGWTDVHGAGAQRSDPKAGNPADYPTGHGPQGDAIRIYNFIRFVRDAGDTPENRAPETPDTPDGSSSGQTDTEYIYSSSTTDPDGDMVYYQFDWDDGTDSGWLGPYASGSDVTASHAWNEAGSYEVKVKAKDVHDNESGWSDVLSVSIAGVPEERKGDVNNDGSIDILDVLAVVFHILGTDPLTGDALDRADCDGNGDIDVLDVLGIVNVILGLGECVPGNYMGRLNSDVFDFLNQLKAYLSPQEFNRFMSLVKGETGMPEDYSLSQNYPNPFNPETDIRYQIADRRYPIHTTLKIYNVLGQEVQTLVDEVKEAGEYTVSWDGRDNSGQAVPSGVYFYCLTSGDFTATKRMVLMK